MTAIFQASDFVCSASLDSIVFIGNSASKRVMEPVDSANRKASWTKNIQRGTTNLMDHLKKLTGEVVTSTN